MKNSKLTWTGAGFTALVFSSTAHGNGNGINNGNGHGYDNGPGMGPGNGNGYGHNKKNQLNSNPYIPDGATGELFS